MHLHWRVRIAFSALTAFLSTTSPASAEQVSEPERSPFHVDGEVDPTAFALGGYSLHLGLGYRRWRLDLGAFALDIPELVHGNAGFSASENGYGAKVHYFPLAEQRWLFAGIDLSVGRLLVARDGTDLARTQTQISPGVHVGCRVPIVAGFYATPWIGVSYDFGANDIVLGGATYRSNPVTVFPAVHLGYQFQ